MLKLSVLAQNGHGGIANCDAHRVVHSDGILDAMCFFKDLFIWLRYFNQLDATSKVMYRHEIICTGYTAQFN